MDKKKFMYKSEGKWKPFHLNYVNDPAYGGLIGTPLSFVTYVQELLKPECALISDKFKEDMFTENKTNRGENTGMCLSWFKGQLDGHRYFSHAGGGGGYYCEIRLYPDLKLGSVVFFNRTGTSDQRFLDLPDSIYLEEQGL